MVTAKSSLVSNQYASPLVHYIPSSSVYLLTLEWLMVPVMLAFVPAFIVPVSVLVFVLLMLLLLLVPMIVLVLALYHHNARRGREQKDRGRRRRRKRGGREAGVPDNGQQEQ
jgi:membrane protein implicated in regulation of membrane protease activity